MDKLIGIFGLLFAAAISVRIYLVYRENQRLPIILNGADTAHDFIHKVLAGIIFLQALNILIFRLQTLSAYQTSNPEPTFYLFLGPLQSMETPTIKMVGLLMAYLGLVWCVTAQHQMGKSWRIGIDTIQETSIVTHGLYTLSRHPIYLGFMVISTGLFLAVPNILTLVCTVLTLIALSIEARLEEEFLLSLHGDSYKEFLARTRRWL